MTPERHRGTNLQNQYNALLTQIDQLAGDSSYNGVNLLNGDNLKVTFNETGTSSLTIRRRQPQLRRPRPDGDLRHRLPGQQQHQQHHATSIRRSTPCAARRRRFGSNLTTVQTRQDFTKNLINTLQTGSDNLVLADTNQEGANLLALQTRQQLSTTALSLSSQSDQAILKVL